MRLSGLGEFGLIERVKGIFARDSSVVKGIGDDCAVMEFSKKEYLLCTTDTIAEEEDFSHSDDPYLIGRKSLAVSISDIAACAGIPRYALVALSMPKSASVRSFDRIIKGVKDIAAEFNVNVVGGDLSADDRISVTTSVIGIVEKKNLVLRSGAKQQDIIFVTGDFGGSIKGKHFNFIPRVKEARFLVKNFKIHSMIDASDGLSQDLFHILDESGTGAIIYEDKIPKSGNCRDINDALCSGEDFELIFTMSADQARRLSRIRRDFKAIGYIADKNSGLRMVDLKGKSRKLSPCGFTHF